MPDIRLATVDDLDAVGRTLAAAFDGDPVWRWMTPNTDDFQPAAARWFRAEARAQLRGHGHVLVDDQHRGAALWAPPGRWRSTTIEGLQIALPSLRLFGRGLRRSLDVVRRLEAAHPAAPHWYLAILGTDPDHQGSGVGSALIREVTDRCDAEGLGAYLESSKESNVPFYARHGFRVTDEVHLPNGPTLWLMWRDPQE